MSPNGETHEKIKGSQSPTLETHLKLQYIPANLLPLAQDALFEGGVDGSHL